MVFSKRGYLRRLAWAIEDRPDLPTVRADRPAAPPDRRPVAVSQLAKSRAQPCSRCSAVREPATRDEQGQPLCPSCLVSDPVNLETCTGCGRRRRISARTTDGPICERCRPWKTLTCSICGRTGPCVVSKTTGKPWYRTCTHHWARCVH